MTQTPVGQALAALGGGMLPLHIHTQRIYKRLWFLTFERKRASNEPDLDDWEFCELLFEANKDGQGNRITGVRFPGDKYTSRIMVERIKVEPTRDFEGKILRDAKGEHTETRVRRMVEIEQASSWYGGLLRRMGSELSPPTEGQAMHAMSLEDMTRIMLEGVKRLEYILEQDASDDRAAREVQNPNYPAGWRETSN